VRGTIQAVALLITALTVTGCRFTTPDGRVLDLRRYDSILVEDVQLGQIHGLLPDGTLVKGLEVFRQAYDAVGLGWLLAPTRWPILRWVSDAGYAWFARNRLRLTGRSGACDSGRCRVS